MDGWINGWTEKQEYVLWPIQWAFCSYTSFIADSPSASSPERVSAKRQAANKLNETRSRSSHQIGLYRRVSSEKSVHERESSLVDSLNIYIAKRRQRSFGPFLGILCWYGNSVVSCSTLGILRAGRQPTSQSQHSRSSLASPPPTPHFFDWERAARNTWLARWVCNKMELAW